MAGYGAGRASKLLTPCCDNESYLFQKQPVTPYLTPLILLSFIFNLQTYVYFIMPLTK